MNYGYWSAFVRSRSSRQAELKQSLRQRRLKMTALANDLERRMAVTSAGVRHLHMVRSLALSNSPRSRPDVPWLWAEVSNVRSNRSWIEEDLPPGAVRGLSDGLRCELRFPRTTEGHVFRRATASGGGPTSIARGFLNGLTSLVPGASRVGLRRQGSTASTRATAAAAAAAAAAGVVALDYDHAWTDKFQTHRKNLENLWFFHVFARTTAEPADDDAAQSSGENECAPCDFMEVVLLEGTRVVATTTVSVAELLRNHDASTSPDGRLDIWLNLHVPPTASERRAASKSSRHVREEQPEVQTEKNAPWSVRLRLAQVSLLPGVSLAAPLGMLKSC